MLTKEIININDLERKDHFLFYSNLDNPLISIVTKVEITNIYHQYKTHKHFYAIMSYCVMKAANSVKEFRLRFDGNNIIEYHNIGVNVTDMIDENNFLWFGASFHEDYLTFLEGFLKAQETLKRTKQRSNLDPLGEFYISCTPNYKFTSLSVPHNKSYIIPQFIWDKYEIIDDKVFVNMFILGNHGFIDGAHFSKFLTAFKTVEREFKIN